MRIVTLPLLSSLKWVCLLIASALAAAAYLTPGPAHDALLLVLSIVIAACGLLAMRRQTRRLALHNAQLMQNVAMLETAEGMGGYGRWCIECQPRRHDWSSEMCRLVGLPILASPDELLLHRFIPRGYEQIELVLRSHASDPEVYDLEFEVTRRHSASRVLRAKVKNIFAQDGTRERIFMVVHDATAAYTLLRDRDEALEKARLARQEADTDPLTGLANRRFTMAQLDKEVIAARQSCQPLSIVVFDIDCFKAVNDRHGHPVGDKVIRTVAEIATRQGRGSDTIGRIGGEEFLWIMPGCDEHAALQAAERLRWAVEAGTHSAPIPSVTISAGHAEVQTAEAPLLLFARADEALYEAKRAGRNQVAKAA